MVATPYGMVLHHYRVGQHPAPYQVRPWPGHWPALKLSY